METTVALAEMEVVVVEQFQAVVVEVEVPLFQTVDFQIFQDKMARVEVVELQIQVEMVELEPTQPNLSESMVLEEDQVDMAPHTTTEALLAEEPEVVAEQHQKL